MQFQTCEHEKYVQVLASTKIDNKWPAGSFIAQQDT